MSLQHQNTKVLGYLFVFIGLVLLLIFAKPAYDSMLEKGADLDIKKSELSTKDQELAKLNEIKKEVENAKEGNTEFSRFMRDFNANDLFTYIYGYADNRSSIAMYKFDIDSLSISEPETTELGMNRVIITMDATFNTLKGITNFIDYMTDVENDYSFYITEIDLPSLEDNQNEEGISVSIPLMFFYK